MSTLPRRTAVSNLAVYVSHSLIYTNSNIHKLVYLVKRGCKHPTEHRISTESLSNVKIPPLAAMGVNCDSSKFSKKMLVTSNTFYFKLVAMNNSFTFLNLMYASKSNIEPVVW